MSITQDAETGKHERDQVNVTLTITDEDGNSQDENKSIPGGPTEVPALKTELGVGAETALWVIPKHGARRQLADHETHNVKEGDHYEALVRGGVS